MIDENCLLIFQLVLEFFIPQQTPALNKILDTFRLFVYNYLSVCCLRTIFPLKTCKPVFFFSCLCVRIYQICLHFTLQYNTTLLPSDSTIQLYCQVSRQYNFIAKCQDNCTRNVSLCQVHSSHIHAIHAIHKASLNYNNSKHTCPGKKSFINKYMRNPK